MKRFQLLSVGAWAPVDHIFKMEHYPKEGETLRLDMDMAQTGKYYFGDCAPNVAAAASRLGVKTALATIVGEDFASLGYKKHLDDLGVDLSGVEIIEGKKCGKNYIYFDGGGDGFCFSHLGAAENQDRARVDKTLLADAEYVAASEKFSPYTLNALQTASKAGAICCLNGMVDTAGELLTDFLCAADILFINESEYGRLLKSLNSSAGELLQKYKLGLIFCTKGRRGCDIIENSGVSHADITPAEKREDTTGAGDSFCAGTISGLIFGMQPLEAARLGSTVSSFVIEDWGCQTNLPTWERVSERFLKHYGKGLTRIGNN